MEDIKDLKNNEVDEETQAKLRQMVVDAGLDKKIISEKEKEKEMTNEELIVKAEDERDKYQLQINQYQGMINLYSQLMDSVVGQRFRVRMIDRMDTEIIQEVVKITKGGHITTVFNEATFDDDGIPTIGKFVTKQTDTTKDLKKNIAEFEKGIKFYLPLVEKCNQDIKNLESKDVIKEEEVTSREEA